MATALLAAAGWVFSKETVNGMPPFGFIGIRFVLAASLLALFCYKDILRSARSDLIRAAGIGLTLGLSINCWIHGIAVSSTLGEGAFIMSLSMLIVPLLAWPLFKEKPAGIFWLALPVAMTGLLFLSYTPGQPWRLSVNQTWFMAAAILLALYFSLNGRLSRKVKPLVLTTVQLFVTGMVGLLASLLTETWPAQIGADIWGWFLLSTILATSIRYLLQTTGQKYCSSSNAALIMLLEPVWTVVLSVIVYAETLSAHKLTGSSLILLALILYRAVPALRRRKQPVQAGV